VWIFLAATLGMCTLVVLWAIGLAPDVGGLIALAILGLGILVQMADRQRAGSER
jgi:UPF0716 family protein affecting phage T7 exclusion